MGHSALDQLPLMANPSMYVQIKLMLVKSVWAGACGRQAALGRMGFGLLHITGDFRGWNPAGHGEVKGRSSCLIAVLV